MELRLEGNVNVASEDIRKDVDQWLTEFKRETDKLGLRPVGDHVLAFQNRLGDECTVASVREDFKQLMDRLQDEFKAGLTMKPCGSQVVLGRFFSSFPFR
jgi:hypothetical protein